MRVHYLQHVPFEGLGSLDRWLAERRAVVTGSKLYQEARLPSVDEIDWLIILGGPMSVNDEAVLPWLAPEKRFVREALARNKVVLGICLGAQLMANALGARVYPNPEREIGWFPIDWDASGPASELEKLLPSPVEVFHWHGETFDLPDGARRLAGSVACRNQAFSVGPPAMGPLAIGHRAVGLQFHLETTPESARALIENCPGDLAPGRYVQRAAEIVSPPARFAAINGLMTKLLDYLARSAG